MRRRLWSLIIVAIGLAAVVAFGDVRQLADRIIGFRWSAFAAALCLALGNYAIRFVRWEMYLHRQDVAVPRVSSALVFGAGLSLSITPAKLGELLKSYLLRELHGVPATRTAPVVVAEGVTDVLALLVLMIAGGAVWGMQTGLVVTASVLVGGGLVLLAWSPPARWLIDLATRPRFARRFRTALHDMYAGLAALCHPRPLLVATSLAVLAWAFECVGFSLIVNAFPGAHVDLGLAMVIYTSTTIAGALSFLPGGLGVTEGAMTVWLVHGGSRLDRSTALDAALLTRLATLGFAVLLGLVCLGLARRRVRPRG